MKIHLNGPISENNHRFIWIFSILNMRMKVFDVITWLEHTIEFDALEEFYSSMNWTDEQWIKTIDVVKAPNKKAKSPD